MDEEAIGSAVVALCREGIANWDILLGVAYGMSFRGKSRLEIMQFFWDLMTRADDGLTEEDVDLVGSFCA